MSTYWVWGQVRPLPRLVSVLACHQATPGLRWGKSLPTIGVHDTVMALTVFLVVFAFVIVIILVAMITPAVGWTTPRHRADNSVSKASTPLKPRPTISYSENNGQFEAQQHPGIRIDKILVGGAAGVVFMVGALALFLIGIPEIRGLFPIMVVGGIVGAGLLYWWRKQTRF